MSRRTRDEILADALEHFDLTLEYAENGDLGSQLTIDAICMRLSAGIEALAALDPADREALFGDDWAAMWGMRNRIAHGYLLVSAAIVRSTVERDVPGIVARIDSAGDRLAPNPVD